MTQKFEYAFKRMITNEGGYILHKNKDDRGGWTYAGIAENFHPSWEGWHFVRNELDNARLVEMVKNFYYEKFCNPLRLNEVENLRVAYSIFDFGVNAGIRTSAKLAQVATGAIADGIIGVNTLKKINDIQSQTFESLFAISKITRYSEIAERNPSQRKFFRGWVKRTLKVLDNDRN